MFPYDDLNFGLQLYNTCNYLVSYSKLPVYPYLQIQGLVTSHYLKSEVTELILFAYLTMRSIFVIFIDSLWL